MLVIGSRALKHSFRETRVALDWDVVGTRDELAKLSLELEHVYEKAWTHAKAYFVFEDRPFEFIVADGSVWEEVVALEAIDATYPKLGRIRYATPETLLLLKQSHVHLTHHWRKTTRDVDALLQRRVTLPASTAPLLEKLRVHAEGRRGRARCAFGPPKRLFADGASHAIVERRRAMMSKDVARWIDPSRPTLARALPETRDDAAALLAELAMLHAVEHVLLPVHDGTMPSSREEDDAVWASLETICTDVFGRDVRIALAPHAEAAARRIPKRFSHRLLRIASRTSAAHGPRAYAAAAERPDLEAFATYVR